MSNSLSEAGYVIVTRFNALPPFLKHLFLGHSLEIVAPIQIPKHGEQ
jgi:hypothetical protein